MDKSLNVLLDVVIGILTLPILGKAMLLIVSILENTTYFSIIPKILSFIVPDAYDIQGILLSGIYSLLYVSYMRDGR